MFFAIIFYCAFSDKRDLDFYSFGLVFLEDQGRGDIYGKNVIYREYTFCRFCIIICTGIRIILYRVEFG